MNREWHQQHKMPEAAGAQQRIEWNLEHVKHCACRPFPQGLLKQVSPAQKLKLAQASAEAANHALR